MMIALSPPKNKELLGLLDNPPIMQQPLSETTPQKDTTTIDLLSNLDDKVK